MRAKICNCDIRQSACAAGVEVVPHEVADGGFRWAMKVDSRRFFISHCPWCGKRLPEIPFDKRPADLYEALRG